MRIERMNVGSRMSEIVIHGDTVYLSGQVAETIPVAGIAEQMREVLGHLERLLAAAGSNKTRLLSATIYLADMTDFAAMNTVWDAWVAPGEPPVRATIEAKLAGPEYLVEVSVIAAR